MTANTAVVTDAKAAGDFEAVSPGWWVCGQKSLSSATVLDSPPRLVIDFQR